MFRNGLLTAKVKIWSVDTICILSNLSNSIHLLPSLYIYSPSKRLVPKNKSVALKTVSVVIKSSGRPGGSSSKLVRLKYDRAPKG